MKNLITAIIVVVSILILAVLYRAVANRGASTQVVSNAPQIFITSSAPTSTAFIPTDIPVAQIVDKSCQVLLEKAMHTLASVCKKVGRDKACYGNDLVKAEANPNSSLTFDSVGDIANISDIRTLTTAPLDEAQGVWGLSLLKLQVTLPDTLPGQNVTFVVFGNTHVDNKSGDMRTFYFTSGLGVPTCKEAPADSLIVHSPKHLEVTFNANGTRITISSTALLSAEQGKQMSVTLVDGH